MKALNKKKEELRYLESYGKLAVDTIVSIKNKNYCFIGCATLKVDAYSYDQYFIFRDMSTGKKVMFEHDQKVILL